jgi:5-methylcytosine-specific restriction endonuclease McrA
MAGDWIKMRFCVPAADRKSLGRVVRAEILTGASCRACASVGPLVIDHIVPIVRGGTSDRTNLQPLCDPCNRAKGRKTMSEFMSGRRQ